jgi:CRISPR-associated exonuclease Cas4
MDTLLIIAISIVITGCLFLLLLHKQRQKLGILGSSEITYMDSEKIPAHLLQSETIPLVGKPDYMIKKDDFLMPVEVKTGSTPRNPYTGHVMQLMAYCYLIEEEFDIRPPGGILKYPKKEFKIAYTEEAKRSVETIVREILVHKNTREELHCEHRDHYRLSCHSKDTSVKSSHILPENMGDQALHATS